MNSKTESARSDGIVTLLTTGFLRICFWVMFSRFVRSLGLMTVLSKSIYFRDWKVIRKLEQTFFFSTCCPTFSCFCAFFSHSGLKFQDLRSRRTQDNRVSVDRLKTYDKVTGTMYEAVHIIMKMFYFLSYRWCFVTNSIYKFTSLKVNLISRAIL